MKVMQTPNKIDVLGEEWEIQLVNEIKNTSEDSDAVTLGETNVKENMIYLRNDLSEECKRKTLLHEIVHIMLYELGRYEIWDSEEDVQAIATGLLHLIRGNEKLIDFLTRIEGRKERENQGE